MPAAASGYVEDVVRGAGSSVGSSTFIRHMAPSKNSRRGFCAIRKSGSAVRAALMHDQSPLWAVMLLIPRSDFHEIHAGTKECNVCLTVSSGSHGITDVAG